MVVTGRNDKSGQETVEVVHEALIREWGRLRQWVNENREKLIQQRKIETGATEWRDKGKSKDYLLGGKQLNEAKTFQKEQSALLTLSPLASEFIQKSLQYRRNNRLKLISFEFIPIILLTISLGFIGYREIRIRQLLNNVETAKDRKDSYIRFKALEELVYLRAPLNNIELGGVNLNGAFLNRANLESANLESASLESANVNGAFLNRANLSYANLSGVYFDSSYLNGANLYSANLNGATLVRAYLVRAYLESADLTSAYLESANLSSANLSYANLSSANLSYANLSSAIFKDAQFGCVKIWEGKIECTNLRNAQNLTPEQVKQAKNWEKAEYDREFREKLGLPPESAK